MKIHKIEKTSLTRISFGPNKSISFEDTNTKKLFDVFIQVFKNYTITKTIEIKNSSVFSKPGAETRLTVTVRSEEGTAKGASKSRSLYWISDNEALKVFVENYQKYI